MAAITVIGGTGYAGSVIVSEAQARGHQVTSVSRRIPEAQAEGVSYLALDATTEVPDLQGSDVVIAALSPRGSNLGALPAAYRAIGAAAEDAGARFVAIGGFSSLRPAEGAPRFTENPSELPAEFAAEALEMNSILTELRESESALDWIFVSPAAAFGSHVPGERLGRYRVSGDVALFDEDGQSAISGADFAAAVLDEIETPTAHRAQIHFAY